LWKHITTYKLYKIIFLFIICHISKTQVSCALADMVNVIVVSFDTLLE